MRALALDFGAARTGVAVSDATGNPVNGMFFLGAVLVLGAIGAAIGMRGWAGRNPVEATPGVQPDGTRVDTSV